MSGGNIVLTVDQSAMLRVKEAMAAEADGSKLKTALNKELKAAIAPAIQDAKEAILAVPSRAVHQEPIRQAIAQAIKPSVSYGARSVGVSAKAARGKYPRGFSNAAGSFNHRGWKHPLWGRGGNTVFQVGAPGWFDKAMQKRAVEYKEAVVEALEEMAERIAARVE